MKLPQSLVLLVALLATPLAGAAEPSIPTPSAQPQLNVPGFAYCLAQEVPSVDLDAERAANGLGATDLLLLYLSLYPGKRLPPPMSLVQNSAHKRWAVAFADREKILAERLRAHSGSAPQSLAPSRFFRDALDACNGSVFCAALISHNVLRTLGRHEQARYRDSFTGATHDLNPAWFTDEQAIWLVQIPMIQSVLIGLRPDGGGDGWGEWYHFFGILAFSIHEVALNQGMANVEIVVRLNELLNPLLAGGPEGPEKARLDHDSVQVDWNFLRGEGLIQAASCDDKASYVAND